MRYTSASALHLRHMSCRKAVDMRLQQCTTSQDQPVRCALVAATAAYVFQFESHVRCRMAGSVWSALSDLLMTSSLLTIVTDIASA
jgi:hypothetical protein